MKTKFIAGFILLMIVAVIYSCENKQGAHPAVVCDEDTVKLTYSSSSNTMQAIINVQCGVNNPNCHPAGGGASSYDYSTYAGIYANYQNGLLYQALFGGGNSVPQMPLSPQPGWSDSGSCVLEKFKAWINQGCPQ